MNYIPCYLAVSQRIGWPEANQLQVFHIRYALDKANFTAECRQFGEKFDAVKNKIGQLQPRNQNLKKVSAGRLRSDLRVNLKNRIFVFKYRTSPPFKLTKYG
jgi:tRNA nucleotidyltransferase/poly(A) polymerase